MKKLISRGLVAAGLFLILAVPAYAEGTTAVRGNMTGTGTGTGAGIGTGTGLGTNAYGTRAYPSAGTGTYGTDNYTGYGTNNYSTYGTAGTTAGTNMRAGTIDGRYRAAATNNNNNGSWGWLGLLGLIGLAGMRRRDPQGNR